ncbi:conserved hypothetical protein [Mycobacterium tuberculosis T92]|nr:conserved hypothetical protein [Mycobacterium tuberculosis T92]
MVRQLSHDGDAVGDPRDFADRAACRNAACASALRRAYRRRAQRERTGERPVDPGSHHRWLSGPAGSGVPYPPGAGLVDQPEPQGDSPTETGGLGQWPACHLLGVTGATLDRPGRPLGPLLETFVANEIRKQLTWSTERPSLWHFRDRDGAEVDLVLEHPDGRVCGIEVKATSTPRAEDLRGLRYLAERLDDRFQFGVLLTAAPEATPFGPTLAALPVSTLWAG